MKSPRSQRQCRDFAGTPRDEGVLMAIEPSSVDWASASRVSYLVRQTFRYEYSEPIRDLNHRLVVIPPERFGDQIRLRHDLSVAGEGVRYADRSDRFGNVIFDVFAPRVLEAIEFVAEISVERHALDPNRLPDVCLPTGYPSEPSPLTPRKARFARPPRCWPA